MHKTPVIFYIKSEDELEKVASAITDSLRQTKLLLLKGDLGAGKTTLSKLIIYKLIGFTEVRSPTFTIMNSYEMNGEVVFHYDLYRIELEEELFNLSLEEDIDKSYVIIEWPEIAMKTLSKYEYTQVEINIKEEGRVITIS